MMVAGQDAAAGGVEVQRESVVGGEAREGWVQAPLGPAPAPVAGIRSRTSEGSPATA